MMFGISRALAADMIPGNHQRQSAMSANVVGGAGDFFNEISVIER
jgi:hypothetical protein